MPIDDSEFDELLEDYLAGRFVSNPEMEAVRIERVHGNPLFGADHIAAHGITTDEVEEVLLELPPLVEARRHKEYSNRTIFWGATREGRWLFVSCEDCRVAGTRVLKPITAFEPDAGIEYWNSR